MNDVIDNPSDCEVRSVIRFLNARHLKPAEIYRQLKEVYGDTVMNERNVRKWCEMFNNGQTNVHDETRPGRPSLITEDLKTKVNDRILQDRRTSLDELHIAFPDISHSLLGEIVSQHLGYHKICARPHTAASTRGLLDQFGWEIFDHPPYSPDLAPSDFHLFTKLKDFLGGTRFGSDEELKKTVNTWLNELAAEECNTGNLKLCERPKTTFTKLEQRSWIKIEVTRDHSAQECFKGLHEACADAALLYRTVARWVKAFREGRDAVQHNLCTGRPRVEDNTVQLLASLLDTDRRWTVRELAVEVGVCHKTVLHILQDILGYRGLTMTLLFSRTGLVGPVPKER
ncbi:hypothetical protein ANN_07666 [Periplaneta americana]|uniref:Mos1 transposase HTH domain-containing protein n=1 Tax=Periplaneta americana TaxID=6978 RepID=A0ABQ8SZ80_PERAM|nr:hypothetical protein ANN_07666 [Periplaneta americana]